MAAIAENIPAIDRLLNPQTAVVIVILIATTTTTIAITLVSRNNQRRSTIRWGRRSPIGIRKIYSNYLRTRVKVWG